MRCKSCDYPLWNLKARQCPECGQPFRPGDYDFVINSVKFCCPQCGQPYYGTSDRGHLVPPEFTCITCGAAVRMDDMVLLPAAGVREEQTRIETMPWLERAQSGWFRAWFKTIVLGLLMPVRLMRSVPPESSLGQAWYFAAVTLFLYAFCGWGLFLGVIAALIAVFDQVDDGLEVLVVGLISTGSISASLLVYVALWGLVTHAVLKLGGATMLPIGRTYQALCYSVGAASVLAVPVIGLYPFGFVPMLWWLVCGTLMVAEAHRCHGGRAAVATVAWPALLLIGGVGIGTIAVVNVVRAAGPTIAAARATAQAPDTALMAVLVREHTGTSGGQWPEHAVALLEDGAQATSFVPLGDSGARAAAIRIGPHTLADLPAMGPTLRREAVQRFIETLPQRLIAHRLGDFVFTYHGIDLTDADSGSLWVVVKWPDPASGLAGAAGDYVFASCVDGTMQALARDDFPVELVRQNQARASAGLPPLPDPASITHEAPALAPDG